MKVHKASNLFLASPLVENSDAAERMQLEREILSLIPKYQARLTHCDLLFDSHLTCQLEATRSRAADDNGTFRQLKERLTGTLHKVKESPAAQLGGLEANKNCQTGVELILWMRLFARIG
jgi:hypothetical protein